MGSCFYNIGWQYMPVGYGYYGQGRGQIVELEAQTEAWQEARRLAFSRLAEEARRAKADAVVGVRIERGAYDWARGLIEFIAVGTAVVSDRYDLGKEPVLSNLSGQDFAKLYRNGYCPAGIVAGTTVTYVMTGWQQQRGVSGFRSTMLNQELPDFTAGIQAARQAAMLRVTREAHAVQASGVVGLRFELSQHTHERRGDNSGATDLIVTAHALGTAIVELAAGDEPPPVYIALPLS
jgi:uncharacterized protein YbjQ (UPF0145 family)